MYYILYNPLSKSGKNQKKIKKLQENLTSQNQSFVAYNIVEMNNISNFISQLSKDDKVIFVGGDGTIHYVANFLKDKEFSQELFAYGAGTGNDFFRNIGIHDGMPKINEHIRNLPKLTHRGGEELFVNGCGLGVDAEVCSRVNNSRNDSSIAYGINAIISFLTYKPFDCEMIIDGTKHTFKRVWLTSIMHGKYQGGGMLFAPDAIREDEWLEVMVAYKMSRFQLITLFPSIYKGQHIKHQKRGLAFFKAKKIEIITNRPVKLQMDGEVRDNIERIVVER